MKWQGRRQSGNVTRKSSSGGSRGGGGFPMIPIGGGGGGIILLIILFLIFGNRLGGGQPTQNDRITNQPSTESTELNDERDQFLAVVMADTEDVWHEVFKDYGMEYREPHLYLYTGSTRSGCGMADSRMGPFYCPADEGIYIDTSFYDELKNQFDAPGDYAFAYVLAHEVGHHVQKLLGITDEVFALQQKLPETEFNKYMVRMELQADYFAGLFSKYVQEKGYLEQGDIQEAMNAAAGVGDDRIQEKSLGRVIPDKFTHGTSEQRMRWFNRGFEYADLEHSDTFNAADL